MRVHEILHSNDFNMHTLSMQVQVWVSDLFAVLMEHSHYWSPKDLPSTTPTPWVFDAPPLEPVNLCQEPDNVVNLTCTDENQ